MCLDFFRINIFSIGKNYHVLLAPGDEQIPMLVEVTEIARVQPTIFQYFGSRIGTVPVALHHNGAANQDFATDSRAVI